MEGCAADLGDLGEGETDIFYHLLMLYADVFAESIGTHWLGETFY